MSRNINDLHPILQNKVTELKTLCEKNGLKIGIGECLRTVEEQNALYAQGRTAPGNIVTNASGTSYKSQHQWGIAFDFYRNDGTGAYNESENFFERVGSIAKTLGLGWGGDWTSIKDRPHVYLSDWGSTTTKLKNQYGTFERFKKTWKNVQDTVPAPTSPTTPTVNDGQTNFIKLGQTHSINFTGYKIGVDGKRGTETRNQAARVLQKALNMDYHVGIDEDGKFGIKSKAALGKHTVRKGEKQFMVTALEILLMLKGYNPNGVEAPGVFGEGLKVCVRKFQSDNELSVDGIAGKATFMSLIS